MTSKLLKYIPDHHTYVEVFGGGASLLFAKFPSKVEVYNDIDSAVVDFFKVLQDPLLFKVFLHKIENTPKSRQLHYESRNTWESEPDKVDRVYKWFVSLRQGFSGAQPGARLPGWAYSVDQSRQGRASSVSNWLNCVNRLAEVRNRFLQVQIEHDDFEKVLLRYDTPDTFFYLDPPYLQETRRSGSYLHEMKMSDYHRLVECLLKMKGKILVSGYYHSVYSSLSHFNRIGFQVKTHTSNKEGMTTEELSRTETLWYNYDLQLSLFDL